VWRIAYRHMTNIGMAPKWDFPQYVKNGILKKSANNKN